MNIAVCFRETRKRGGSWNNNTRNIRSANRNRNNPNHRNNNRGFRCVYRFRDLKRSQNPEYSFVQGVRMKAGAGLTCPWWAKKSLLVSHQQAVGCLLNLYLQGVLALYFGLSEQWKWSVSRPALYLIKKCMASRLRERDKLLVYIKC